MTVVVGMVMLGPEGASPAEQWVAGARQAAALDAARLALAAGAGQVWLATSEAALAAEHPEWPVTWEVDAPGQPFHFGTRLAEGMARCPADIYVYLGAGSAPLVPVELLAGAIATVAEAGATPRAVVNNLHSTDWMVANCPVVLRAHQHDLPSDNALGWVLKQLGGVNVSALPASAATRLDIDTPADVLLLGLHGTPGAALSAFWQAQPGDHACWQAAGRRLFAPGGRVALIGRVSAAVWAHVEANTQAWLRVFSEERGMAASGRLAAGRVKSVVGAHLLRVGARAFFDELSDMVEAVFFDTRVVLAHAGAWPSAADRYAADLGRAADIHDPFLRELTEAALAAPVPVVLGGHGVVAGDLYGLVAAAHAGRLGEAE
jgi:CTP:molybdopterin cytidylyltransferase MocA